MREIEVDGDTIAEVVAYLNGHKTVPAKRMADAVLRLLNRHYQDAAALEAAREDAERLDWLARESIPEGLVHVTSDIYEYACEVAEENGRDEPNDADLLAGHRRMIDAARAIDQARGKGVA